MNFDIENTYHLYLLLSAALFSIGIFGILVRRNVLILFMCLELMFNAVNLAFVSASKMLGTLDGQIAVFFVLTVATAEAAVGLAIVIVLFRNFISVNADQTHVLER
jgi:NADH-quinone oxidoreductase subunit K